MQKIIASLIPPEIRRILSELTSFKKALWIIGLAGILTSLCQSLNVALIRTLLDENKADFQHVLNTAGMMLGLALLAGISRYFHIFTMNYTGEKVIQKIREKLQTKFMNLNLSFYNNFTSGSGGMMSRILNDVVVVQNGLRMFADFFREPLNLVFMIGLLFYINAQLTLMALIVLPVILFFLRQISITIKDFSERGQQQLEKITSTIKETLDGVRIIQSFNLEKEMSNRFQAEGRDFLESRRKVHSRIEISSPVNEFIVTFVVLGIAVFLSYEKSMGKATIGDFVAYIAALLALSPPIKKLQESYVRIQETIVSARRIFQILDDPNEVPKSLVSNPFPKDWDAISYRNVGFSYQSRPILREFSLTIRRGQTVALVGASGSGKSTVVNLLERFFDATSGDIFIGPHNIKSIDLRDLRAHVALVSQDVFLFSDTIERNIWSGDFSKPADQVVFAAKAANADEFISRMKLGYVSRVGDRGGLISGGEKQRVSIARAIFKDAPILILDEATSALDTKSEQEVQRGLDSLMKGRTTIVIAHRLSTVAKADLIVVMKEGAIVESGTHSELMAKHGEYSKMHLDQSFVQ
jgi:subfamily B ATP-binding cassette protein MsbA